VSGLSHGNYEAHCTPGPTFRPWQLRSSRSPRVGRCTSGSRFIISWILREESLSGYAATLDQPVRSPPVHSSTRGDAGLCPPSPQTARIPLKPTFTSAAPLRVALPIHDQSRPLARVFHSPATCPRSPHLYRISMIPFNLHSSARGFVQLNSFRSARRFATTLLRELESCQP